MTGSSKIGLPRHGGSNKISPRTQMPVTLKINKDRAVILCVLCLFLKHLFGNHIITNMHLTQKIGCHYLLELMSTHGTRRVPVSSLWLVLFVLWAESK